MPATETHDVIIVGGGPAGSTCAWRLMQAGFDVLVIDKRTFPRNKVCAGWVTPQVFESLQIEPSEYGQVCQPITGFRTGIIGGEEVTTRYDHTVSYGIRRVEFDHYLLERSGARCRLGESVRQIERRDGLWVINEMLMAPMLVGAGGNFCPVARMLGAQGRVGESKVVAQEAEFPMTRKQQSQVDIEGDTPELFFCDDLRGYGWGVRKGDYLNVGFGRVDPQRLSAHVADFREFLRERGKIGFEIASRFEGHAYRLYEGEPPRFFDDGVLLIGDAAGLAYPQSGEGIRPAIESGMLAADAIVNANGRYEREQLAPYESAVVSRLGQPRKRSQSDWLPASWLHGLASKLMATRWFARRIVMDRWFLHSGKPALLGNLPMSNIRSTLARDQALPRFL